MDITLYEHRPTRSARVRWTLDETGLAFESVDRGIELIGSDELRLVHPLAKVPAAAFNGRPLFESAAICTYVADLAPEAGLIAASGTWERALHDQWCYFAMTELEAWLWSNAQNTFVLPEDERIPAILEQNGKLFRRGLAAVEKHLGSNDYFVDNRFTVTDIVVSFALNFGRRSGLTEDSPNVAAYMERMFARPHCPLNPD